MQINKLKRKFYRQIGIGWTTVLTIFYFGMTFANAFGFQQKESPPNIILIMSDDMGYSDIGCYGGEIPTPHLDQLAKKGLRYTRFYNTSRCCPSRASLLTGLYPHQTGLGWMTASDHGLPGYGGELNKQCITIAELLKSVGYQAFMTGKWHVAKKTETIEKYNWPLQRGFDKFYGIILGASNYYDPATLCRNNTLITPFNDPEYQPGSYYFTDAISDNSVRYIRERAQDKPFFMYVAYTAAHWPMQAPEKAIKKNKGKYDQGWESIRQERLKRMKKLGIIPKDAELSPPDVEPWKEEREKAVMARRMETYTAMIEIMDDGIGHIIKELKKQGIYDNTVILYLQDNGGCAERVGIGETRPVAENASNLNPLGKDEIQYNIKPPITRNGEIVRQGISVMAGPADTYLGYLKEWANVSNTPFRMYKHWVYEGGISSPLIISWPKGIRDTNTLRKQPCHIIDLLPTLADIAGTGYPETYNGHNITPVAGVSLVPTFTNKTLDRKAIFWEHEMHRAVRMGKWKLVADAKLSEGGYGQWKYYTTYDWELYDMEKDRSELHNLASQYPDKVKQMAAMWQNYAEETHVFPTPWKPRP